MKETGVPGEEHRPTASNWQTLSHNVVSSTSCNERESNTQLLWWDALIAWVVVNPTIIRSQPRRPQYWKGAHLQIHYYTTYCRLWCSIITNIEITSKSYTNYTKIKTNFKFMMRNWQINQDIYPLNSKVSECFQGKCVFVNKR